jgi:predicted RNase H-like nuclease (RuvC/YqgF family)
VSKRYKLINCLNAHDDFRDNKNNKNLDSFDVVELLNHYDELQNILVERDQKIADLETKLAEKERQVNVYACEIAFLDNKLADKYKEIDELEDKLHHYYEETLNKGTCGLCEHLRGEYKADFAIEQLEKVKTQCEFSITFASYEQEQRLYAFIDNQIKELKEGK